MFSDSQPSIEDPIDRLIIQLRAYVASPRRRERQSKRSAWTSGICIIFDTETTTDPSQRLRFGAYQIRDRGTLIARGLFHADDAPKEDYADLRAAFRTLRPTEDGELLEFITRAEFIQHVLFGWGQEVGAMIVGFNLPFDLSRLATAHTYGKGSMKGGFSFTYADKRPNIRIKHLSQRAAFINFAGKGSADVSPDRGFFVDVKTLAASLLGQSHSLASLSALLKTTPKSPLDSYEGRLTPEMVAYCLNDVQVTWECFDVLAKRYQALGLSQTGLNELYSEASLGKAYLQAMGVQPWTEAQPDFPPEIIGQIMSAYFGGRAEVHIRREITPVIHCDFMSMYPTVCTLMGLWKFVIAEGMDRADATDECRALVETCDLAMLRDPATWRRLHMIVQVSASDDVFPVRAHYEPDQPATIGVNRLSSWEPLWFTLADVIAAKLLGGKTPEIISAIRFSPRAPQTGLKTVTLAGAELNPVTGDFYASIINMRREIQARQNDAIGPEWDRLDADQHGLKILVNATSYGIFAELNVQSLERSRAFICYDHRGTGRRITTSKIEEPGRYFHPLLGALITGGARLMLALAERNALDQGLGWALCDTDSLAIANVAGLPNDEFKGRAQTVRQWFEPLNPYEVKGSILQLEKVNFPPGQHKEPDTLRPVNCLAISAKRYVLFDRDEAGEPVIRKASRHGLGHLIAPYKDPDPTRTGRIGVQLWQSDLWTEIIRAHDAGKPDSPDLDRLPGIDEAAATRYGVTNQTLLNWFKGYNAGVAERDRVWPFNFLLTYQAKSRLEMASVDPEALSSSLWRKRSPKPASRYSSDLISDRPEVFDRQTGEAIAWEHLRSYRRTLSRHHLHSESKFRGGEDAEHGTLSRRHVEAWAASAIGKEADNLDEREAFGEGDDPLVYGVAIEDRRKLVADMAALQTEFGISDRQLTAQARVSHHTLTALRAGGRVTMRSMFAVMCALEGIRQKQMAAAGEQQKWLEIGRRLRDELGSGNKLADLLGVSRPYMHRVLNGRKPLSERLIALLSAPTSPEE
ncbi:hypothetical protein [uncultured Brevundimonas sp.]|uniref:hypothetical protein n=1 Tax=uncultured Brevundimonas sp. TaxID=213418 RepID=UPI0030EDB9F3|tara:strand:- start:188 stop:3283 length:3096 start_codon:yes stop_codon:yes gene_type:complete